MKVETRVGIFIIAAVGVFFYLSFSIGELRIDGNLYNVYKTSFDEASGLDEKAQVKIAGVKVGWVEKIVLLDGGKAEVILRVQSCNRLARNAYAMIDQEGLIGNKYIEIDTADPSTGILPNGDVLSVPGKSPASVASLLEQFKEISNHIQDVVGSIKQTFASSKGEEQLKQALTGVALASEKMAQFSNVLERSMKCNEKNIEGLIKDLRSSAHHLDSSIPQITQDFHDASGKVGDAFGNVDSTINKVGSVVDKVNNGNGLIGQLVNDEELSSDVKKTVKGIKGYVNKTSALAVYLDMHTESLFRTNNTEGYFDVKLRMSDDYFYQFQLVADNNGSYDHQTHYRTYRDSLGNIIPSVPNNDTDNSDNIYHQRMTADVVDQTVQTKNAILLGFQFGKRFNRLTFRVGLFESSFGVGCDFYVPLKTDKFHWITSLEAFDFSGYNRLNDNRPHLKWMNKMFFMRNFYTSFGIDDFMSRGNASPFFGGGIRFGDDDIKYLLGFMPKSK